MTFTNDRPYKIDGYPVSRQELLDQGTMISGETMAGLYIGTSSQDADTLEQIARHLEANGVHPVWIDIERGAMRSQLTVEIVPHEAAEIAAIFASFNPNR